MKTKKSIWSIVLSLVLVFVLALGFGLNTKDAMVKADPAEPAEEFDHIKFNVTVYDAANQEDVNDLSVASNYAGTFVVKYTVVENDGIDALQVRLGYNAEAFNLVSIVTDDTTALGAAEVEHAVNGHLTGKVVFDNLSSNGAVYTATGDTLITATFEFTNNVALNTAYPFGFDAVNNYIASIQAAEEPTPLVDGYSNAWAVVVGENGANSTHEPVEIQYTEVYGAQVHVRGPLEFSLEGATKTYNKLPANNAEITITSAHPELIQLVWFKDNGNGNYTKLNSNPVDVGTYKVVAEIEQTMLYDGYVGYTYSNDVYTLEQDANKVATYTITPASLSISFDYRSAQYKSFTNSTFVGYLAENGYCTLTGVIQGDTVNVSLDATNILNASAGEYGYKVSGNDAIIVTIDNDNYQIANADITGIFDIVAKQIVVGTDVTFNGNSFTWDAQEHNIEISVAAAYQNIVTASYAGGEQGCAGNGAIHVGEHTITATLGLAQGYANNYVLVDGQGEPANQLTATLTIVSIGLNQAQVDALVAEYVTFSAVDGGNEEELDAYNASARTGSYGKVYDRASAYIGVVVASNEGGLSQQVDYSIDGSADARLTAVLANFANYAETNAGEYEIEITFLPAEGYSFEPGVDATYTITLTINKKAITIAAENHSSVYGANPETLTPTTAGLANEIPVSFRVEDNGTAITLSSATPAGQYDIIPYVVDAENYTNYTISCENAIYTVQKATPVITITANDVYYNRALSYTVTVTVAGSAINEYTVTVDDLALPLASILNKGQHTLAVNVAEGANYNAASESETFNVLAVDLKAPTFDYDGAVATWSEVTTDEGDVALVNGGITYTIKVNNNDVAANDRTYTATSKDALVLRVESTNQNYNAIEVPLADVFAVSYQAGAYDIEVSGVEPELPNTQYLFDGELASQPADVALNHYSFVRFAVDEENSAAFDYTQPIEEDAVVYVIWNTQDQYVLTLVYLVEGDVDTEELVYEHTYYDDDLILAANFPALSQVSWFKAESWFADAELETKFVSGRFSENTKLYANYVFNIGLGDVDADGYVGADDVTLYRRWIVGGYQMTVVNSSLAQNEKTEWNMVNSEDFDPEHVTYFLKRVADSNALSAESPVLGDNVLDIRDVSTIRMAMVGGYGFSIMEGKSVDGEALTIVRTVLINNASNLLIVAKSGVAVELADDIEEENFIGIIQGAKKDVVIDLGNNTLTLKSLHIALAANNTGKIEIKNGRINVADGNGVELLAPAGSVILDNVTLYDENGQFTLQAADHSLHFENEVQFLRKAANNEEEPAEVKIEKDTHVVVEATAEVTIEKIVVTENYEPATSLDEEAEITMTIRNEQQDPIKIDGNCTNKIATYDELAMAAQNGGEYTIVADINCGAHDITVTSDLTLDLNNHTITFTKWGFEARNGATLTIGGNGTVSAVEAALYVRYEGKLVVNGGTYVSTDNFVIGTNGSTGQGGNTIEINGGVFNGSITSAGYVACGIYVANDDEVLVNAGTFNITNGVGILARSGHTTVEENVVFNVTGNGALGKIGDARVVLPAGKVLVVDYAANYPAGDPVLVNNNAAEVYALVDNVASMVAVRNNASEIILHGDLSYNGCLSFTKDTTIYLNNHTLRSTGVALAALDGAKLTIKESANGTGAVIAQEMCVMAFRSSELEIDGGTYTAIDNAVFGTNGNPGEGNNLITIKAGTFNGGITSNGYVACGIYVANNDTVVVNGGRFNITNGVGILARSGHTTVGADVVFNVEGDGTLGKVGDAKITVPAGEVLVVDYAANYPGGDPVLVNNNAAEVYALVDNEASLNAAKNVADKIVLANNINAANQIVIERDVEIELNGKTLSYAGQEELKSGLFGVKRGATLTISDSVGTGKVDGTTNAYAAVAVTLKGEAETGALAKVVVNGGTLEGYYYGICGNGSRHNTEVLVNNGTLYGLNGAGIYNPQDGLVTIKNGHIKGYETAIEIRAGQLVIDGGEFEAFAEEFSATANGSGTTIVGAIIAVSQHSTLKAITVTINGGTFANGVKSIAVYDSIAAQHENLITINIYGGTFKIDPTEYLKGNYEAIEENGLYVVQQYFIIEGPDPIVGPGDPPSMPF